MKHILLIILTTFFIFGCQKTISDLESISATKHSTGNLSDYAFIRWKDTPINLKISESFSDEEAGSIEAMSEKWNNVILNYSFFPTPLMSVPNKNYNRLEDFYDNEFGVYASYDWFDDVSSDSLAVTQFFGTEKNWGDEKYLEIFHADIIINYRDHEFTIDGEIFGYDLPSVVLHEMGHFLGLQHQYEQNSVMQPYLEELEQMHNIQEIDIENLESCYLNHQIQEIKSASYMKSETKIIRGIIELSKKTFIHQ